VGAGQRSNPIQQCFCPAPYFDFIRRCPLYLNKSWNFLDCWNHPLDHFT